MIDETRIRELLDEATIDCYGEEEEFSGVMVTLQDNLSFPICGVANPIVDARADFYDGRGHGDRQVAECWPRICYSENHVYRAKTGDKL